MFVQYGELYKMKRRTQGWTCFFFPIATHNIFFMVWCTVYGRLNGNIKSQLIPLKTSPHMSKEKSKSYGSWEVGIKTLKRHCQKLLCRQGVNNLKVYKQWRMMQYIYS